MTSRAKSLIARSPDYTPLVVKELQDLETALGGRPVLRSLLALAPLTKDLRYVLGLLGDPTNDALPLAAVCAKGNLLPGDLLKLLGAAALHKGQTLARQAVGAALPAVAMDLMRKSAPYEDACAACLGTGSITPDPTPDVPNPIHAPCDQCAGSGRLLYQPTFERQKLALEMGGLLPKGGGISITQQNLNLGAAAGAGGGALEQLQMLSDQILYGEAAPPATEDAQPAVDAEVLPPAEAPPA